MSSQSNLALVETGRDVRWLKRVWPPSHLMAIRKALTMIPTKGKYQTSLPTPLKAYSETQWELITPRAWAVACTQAGAISSTLSCPDQWLSVRARDLARVIPFHASIPFVFTLRPFQVDLTSRALTALTRPPYSVLLEVGCGKGKTIMAIFLASQLQLKTLILVQDSFLLNQWVERLTQCLPAARVGRLQQNVNDIDSSDIIIGMVQTVASRYDSSAFTSIGLLIIDECHRMGSPLFSSVLAACIAPHVIGLSATPERQDGMHTMLSWYLGPVISEPEDVFPPVTVIRCPFAASTHVSASVNGQGLPNVVQMLTDLSSCPVRQELLLQWILSALLPDRVILVLSHRREQLIALQQALTVVPDLVTGFYMGGMKQADLDQTAAHATVLLATYAMAQQALDIPRLNTLVMATPMKDMRQSIGRITRLTASGARPVVIDILDKGLPCFPKHAQVRAALYRERSYDVTSATVPAATYFGGNSEMQMDFDEVE